MWLNLFGKISAFKREGSLFKLSALAALCILALCALTQPVRSEIQAKAYDWQARLSRVIPKRELGMCLQTAEACRSGSVEEMCAEIEAMDTRLPREPLRLYTAIKILIRRDAEITVLKNELQAVRKGRELLGGYLSSLKRTRRLKGMKDNHALQLSERLRTAPLNEITPEGTDVLRFLPAPQKTWSDADARKFYKAADSDLKLLEAREEILKSELKDSEESCSPWRRFVDKTGRSLNPETCLPKRVDNPADKPLQELVYPAPPFDLKPLQPAAPAPAEN